MINKYKAKTEPFEAVFIPMATLMSVEMMDKICRWANVGLDSTSQHHVWCSDRFLYITSRKVISNMNIVKEISGVIPYETYLVKQDGVLSLVSKAKFENENEKLSKF